MSDNVKQNDEIDLIELFQVFFKWVKSAFNQLGNLILNSIIFLYAKKWFLFLFLIIGIAASLSLYYSSPRIYSSECLIQNNFTDNQNLVAYINRLNDFIIKKDYNELNKVLNIEEAELKNIKHIQAYFQIDKNKDAISDFTDYTEKDTSLFKYRMNDKLVLVVESENTVDLSKLENNLLTYILSNQLFVNSNNLRIKQNNDLIALYNQELEKLDKLQNIEYFEKKNYKEKANSMLVVAEQEPQLYYKNKIELTKLIQNIEKEQLLYKEPITIIQSFSPWIQPENNLIFYLKRWVSFVFISGLALLIILSNTKRLKKLLVVNQVKLKKVS